MAEKVGVAAVAAAVAAVAVEAVEIRTQAAHRFFISWGSTPGTSGARAPPSRCASATSAPHALFQEYGGPHA